MDTFLEKKFRIQWNCEECGHEFQTVIEHLPPDIPSCPECGGKVVWYEEVESVDPSF